MKDLINFFQLFPGVYHDNPVCCKPNRLFIENTESLPLSLTDTCAEGARIMRAGPRRQIFFEPEQTKAAIVTCGGLCPGLNSVIRELVMTLQNVYGVHQIVGIPYGYQGFSKDPEEYIPLNANRVDHIHREGGTVLGSSRGGHNTERIVESLIENNINQVYIIGGDGTQRGALKIYEEILNRKLPIAVVGIPKTIDNDILHIDRSFGFDTCVEEARNVLAGAAVEARSSHYGIGIVKLMGRHSGFITMHATLASREADICLIPELPFKLEGSSGLLEHIARKLRSQNSCVLAIAEGAGQDLVPPTGRTDPSGNPVLADFIPLLTKNLKEFLPRKGLPAHIRVIDPSYLIRSVPANGSDNIYCSILAQNAVHGAMAGFTGFVSGLLHNHYVYFPMEEIAKGTRTVKLNERMWQRILDSTGQPEFY
jgi:6-phosphofructokinase 1